MYILQDNKLYVQKGKKQLVGVNVGPDKIVETSEKAELKPFFQILTPSEVRSKFNIREGNEYKFPVEKKTTKKKTEVVKDESTKSTKRTTRKSTSK